MKSNILRGLKIERPNSVIRYPAAQYLNGVIIVHAYWLNEITHTGKSSEITHTGKHSSE